MRAFTFMPLVVKSERYESVTLSGTVAPSLTTSPRPNAQFQIRVTAHRATSGSAAIAAPRLGRSVTGVPLRHAKLCPAGSQSVMTDLTGGVTGVKTSNAVAL